MAEAAAVAATAVVASAAGRNLRTFFGGRAQRAAGLRGLLVDALHDQVKWVLLELSFEES